MGFFSRRKKQEQKKGKASVAEGGGGVAVDRKEPLLEDVPADEPRSWTDVDGTKTSAIRDLNDPEEGDCDLSLPSNYREQVLASKGLNGCTQKLTGAIVFMLGCGGAITTIKLILWGTAAAAIVTLALLSSPVPVVGRDLRVAFIGNSYFFVNDLPRLMGKVTGDRLTQDSCLHGSGSMLNILKTGNGMYYKWQSANAMIDDTELSNFDAQGSTLYDYGACSVPQLLTGKDSMLSYNNQDGNYEDDGTNPCLMDSTYLQYENATSYTGSWDYVVIVDQSKRMSFDEARDEALMAMNYTYAPLLNQIGATPVLVQPHAFWSSQVNMTGLNDVPTFTAMISEGAQIYKEFLDERLKGRKTKIAPVGNAYLTVWEENIDLWQKLFLDDGIHPSGYGSYLYSLVIHATLYQVLPPKRRVVTEAVGALFSDARKLHSNYTMMPSKDEALQLYRIARRVGIFGHTPTTLQGISASDFIDSQANDDDSQQVDDNEYYAQGDDAAR